MAIITDIAQAVTDELNDGAFSQEVTAARSYLPLYDLEDMDALHVTVVPKASEAQRLDRSRHQADYQIDIGIQQKLSTLLDSEIDDLMTLTDEIDAYLRDRQLSGYPSARWLKSERDPIYAPEHLQSIRQFTALITATYRVLG